MNWLYRHFELARGGEAHNVRPMEGMRGFAVFLVFLVHYVTAMEPWLTKSSLTFSIATGMNRIGHTGVDLFFVLSGYLIYGSLIAKKQEFPRFFWRRVVRIYPTYTIVFLLYLILSLVFPQESKIPAPLSAALIYLAENYLLLTGFRQPMPMITVAWTLTYEMLYYATIPLLIAALNLRERSTSWRVVFFSTTLVIAAGYFSLHDGPIRLLMFVAGILLYEALQYKTPHYVGSVVGLVALIAGLGQTLIPAPLVVTTSLLWMAFFTFSLACFAHPREWLARCFSWTPLRWLGNMSYSYYLLHGLVLKAALMIFAKILSSTPSAGGVFWALSVPMFVVTLIPSALLFIAIERPFSLSRTRPAQAAQPSLING